MDTWNRDLAFYPMRATRPIAILERISKVSACGIVGAQKISNIIGMKNLEDTPIGSVPSSSNAALSSIGNYQHQIDENFVQLLKN